MQNEALLEAIDALSARLRNVQDDHATMRILPPLTEPELEAAEAELGASLPDDYRAFLLRVSGGVLVDESYYHLPFDEIVRRRATTSSGEPDTEKRAALPFPFGDEDAARAIAAHEAFLASDPQPDEPDFCIPGNPEGDGVLALYDDGTGAVKVLVVTGEQRGTMWEYGDSGWVPEHHVEGGKPVQDTFLTWFSRWLDETEEALRAQLAEPIVITPDQTSFGLFERKLKAIPSEVLDATQLEYLNLNSDHLTEVPPEIGRLVHLKVLRLIDNQLTTLPPEIGALTDLEELRLERNRIASLPAEMDRLAKLRELDLRHNDLDSIPPVLARLPALRSLSLEGNAIPEDEIAALRAARPGVTVSS